MAEYEIGQRLKVKLKPDTRPEPNSEEIELELEIIRPYKPFTMSVVCQVRIINSAPNGSLNSLSDTLILKLFDRRYQMNSRNYHDDGRIWTSAKEAAYQRYLPEAPKARAKLWSPSFEYEEEYKNEGEMEVYIEEACQKFFDNEKRAYDDMTAIQGTHIPKLYGTVLYEPPLPASTDQIPSTANPYQAKGFLLEYIPSITLKAFLKDTLNLDPPPYDTISTVCDQAIMLMDRLDDFNVLNKDAQIWNVLVASKEGHEPPFPSPIICKLPRNTFRCLGIDFGSSRLRYADETDEQWRRAKESVDEMGAVGCMAAGLLERCAEDEGGRIEADRLWRYKSNKRWDRQLNEEEAKAAEADSLWGLHPEAR